MFRITEKQARVLDSLILGFNLSETAERLGINITTVEYHLKKVKRENDMNIIQLVAEYVKRKVRAENECKDLLDKSEL